MFGIGIPELIIILIVALLVVGPSKLPELARSMGKALGEFRRLADDVKDTIEQEMTKEPEAEEAKHEEKQKEELSEEKNAEQRKLEDQDKLEEVAMYSGNIVVEENTMHDAAQVLTQDTAQSTEPMTQDMHDVVAQRESEEIPPEPEAKPTEGPLVAAEDTSDEKNVKIAEGIRVNEQQKT